MWVRIDTPLLTLPMRFGCSFIEMQRLFSNTREGWARGSETIFPDDAFDDRYPPRSSHLANSR